MSKTITLTHFLTGPMRVQVAEDATYWTGHLEFTDVDSDGALHDAGEFEETREQIDALLRLDPLEGIDQYGDGRERTFWDALMPAPWRR